jgi:hypothetical protein
MTTFNTNTDINARGRQMMKAREAAETQVWRLVDLLPALFTRTAPDGQRNWRRPPAVRPPAATWTTCCANRAGPRRGTRRTSTGAVPLVCRGSFPA